MIAPFEIGGLFRCCIQAIPDRAGASDGEHIVCPHTPNDPESGVIWSEKRKAWIAAWRTKDL